MTQIVSSISGIEIWAPSAGSASVAMYDKNSRDLSKCVDSQGASAIASSYQVVSATATQLYAGTAYLTNVNTAPISAARAGNAANASMANSAYYDGTGRLISSLPDEATVSAIASAYADDKLDKTAQVVTATAGDGTYVTSINGMEISGQGGGGGGGDAFPVDYNSGSCSASLETGYFVSTSRPSLTLSSTGTNIYPRFIVRNGTGTASKGSYYLSDAFEFTTGAAGGSGTKVLRVDPQQVSSKNFLLFGPSGSNTYGTLALGGADDSAYVRIGSGTEGHVNYVRPSSISSWWDVHDTVSANSATWGGGVSLPITGTQDDYSASHGISSVDFTYAEDGGASNLYTGSFNISSIEIDFTPDNEEFYSTQLTHNYLNFTGPNHNQSMGPSEIEYWNDVASTVSTESGNWGGVDEATVSSIASSYAESSVSSKADSSALSSYALSADVSGVIDTVSSNSASWGGGVDSATVSSIASSYAQDVSAAVSGTVDTVSSQSANWGGSALALSAGPGVKLEKVGDTLVVGADETVLYSATAYAPGDTQQSYSLIETPMNFETVRVLAYRPLANGAPWFGSVDIQIANLYNYTAANTLMAMPYAFVSTANNIFYEGQYFINNITSTSWEDGSSTQRKTTETAYTTGYYAHIYKIIGINRTAGV